MPNTFPMCSVSKMIFAVMVDGPLQLVSVSHRENEASEKRAWGPVPGTYAIWEGKPNRKKLYI